MLGEAGDGRGGGPDDHRARARRRAARRAHAGRRRGRGDPRRSPRQRPAQRFLALSVSDAAEDVIAVIRAGARGYVTKTISGARARRRGAARARRRRGLLAAARRLRARRVRRPICRRREVDPELDQLTPREREVLPLHRPRLPLQGDRAATPHLGEDRRGARQRGAAQAAALEPPRAQPLGGRAPADRLSVRGPALGARRHAPRPNLRGQLTAPTSSA